MPALAQPSPRQPRPAIPCSCPPWFRTRLLAVVMDGQSASMPGFRHTWATVYLTNYEHDLGALFVWHICLTYSAVLAYHLWFTIQFRWS